jgi:hypothetical protein
MTHFRANSARAFAHFTFATFKQQTATVGDGLVPNHFMFRKPNPGRVLFRVWQKKA